ncbi:MAG: hypothetical protein V1897_05790 [Pseudomonadota bacterium]
MDAWLTILISFLTSAGVTSGIMKLISSRVEHKYQKAIEGYKHELNAINEQQRFNYQRWITDFGLFTQKKHEAYAELYRLILIANGSLEGLYGFRQVPSFNEYTRQDMEKHLLDQHIVAGFIPQLLEGWEESREGCVRKIHEYQTMIEFQKADRARTDASNYYLLNSVYLSETVENIVSEVLTLLGHQYVIDYQSRIEHYSDETGRAERKQIKERKPVLISKLKATIRSEMSVGYYTENPETRSLDTGMTEPAAAANRRETAPASG